MSAITGYYAPAGQGWRLAYCLVTLAHELADVYGDQLECKGTVGDTDHAAQGYSSDHNDFILDPTEPSIGIVRAIDFGGPDALLKGIRQHIWELYAAQDPRVYRYGYAKGCGDNLINNWGLPFGTHVDTGDAGHLHISVTQANGNNPSPSGYVAAIDSTAPWGFAGTNPDSGGGTQITDPTEDDMFSDEDRAALAKIGSGASTARVVGWIVGGANNQQWLVATDLRSKLAITDGDVGRLSAAKDFNGQGIYGTGLGIDQATLDLIPAITSGATS